MGLLRRIWHAGRILLLGEDHFPVTQADMVRFRIEWEEYQLAFEGILDKLNTFNARIAKRQKDLAKTAETLAQAEQAQPQPVARSKADLYRRAVGGAGQIALVRPGGNPPPPPPPPDDGENP